MTKIRNLVLVLGDQLNHDSAALDEFDAQSDRIWMAENDEESTHVWCHKYRLVAFFAPMRHFRDECREAGREVIYHELTADRRKSRGSSFASVLSRTLKDHDVRTVVMAHPGDHRVREQIRETVADAGVELREVEDRHYYCQPDEFEQWAEGRKTLVMETFYRSMRKKHGVLMDEDGDPVGGEWNYDRENRGTFGKTGPKDVPPVPSFEPDATTRAVIEMVEGRFGDHPGSTDKFNLPVTRDQAIQYLDDFIEHRLAEFGTYQDAMWTDTEFLYHSRLSNAINLHLLSPREVVDAAVDAYHRRALPINCVEGFVRQIIGWREYVRGIYWTRMPEYADRNSLDCDPEQDVPSFFWDGETGMTCVADSMRLLIDHAYAHHIQRLMVLGLFAQLYGVHPDRFNRWHVAMYADAIDWVSVPNTIGMSQHGDGGLMATKPYCASGKYVSRQGNYCSNCRYDPAKAVGDDACPFTTLYWDFLDRHADRFRSNHRMGMQVRNLDNKPPEQLVEIRKRADAIKRGKVKV